MVYPDKDRNIVKIKNHSKNPAKERRNKRAITLSVVIAIIALVLCFGIYFRWDEKLISLFVGDSSKANDEETALASKETAETVEKNSDSENDISNESQSDENTTSAEDTEPKDISIIFTGDVLLSDYVRANYDEGGIDSVVTPELRQLLSDADILEINEEFPFGTGGTKETDKQYTFRADPKYISIFEEMGVDAVGLANNHVLDFGKDCLNETFTTLDAAGLPYTGAGDTLEKAKTPIVIEKNGKTFAFLAASRVIPKASWDVRNAAPGVFTCYDTTELISSIQDAKSKYDFVFVCVHWGTEHTTELTDYQQNMGHSFIDAGADAVIGSHPHILQGIEYYNGKPIFYSLGNFIFNKDISETAAVNLTVSDDNSLSIKLIPAKAKNATTYLQTSDEAKKTYEGLMSISPNVNIDDDGNVTEKN